MTLCGWVGGVGGYDQLCCPASPKLLLGLDLGLGCDNILDSMFLKGLKWVENCVGYNHIKQQTACACYVELRFIEFSICHL